MITFELAKATDIHFITAVYNYYIKNSTATFHTEPINEKYIEAALPFNHDLYKTYIIKYNGEPCGYCYIGNFKPRQAYNKSAEVTLYLKAEFYKKGIGKQTLIFLESQAKQLGLKNLLGNITAENIASVSLFKKMNYDKVAHFKNIGEKFGRSLDVVIYQKEI